MSSVKFASSLAAIGDYAFAGCTSITEINLNVSYWNGSNQYTMAYVDVGRYAFAYCSNLTTVTFKNNSGWGTLYDGAFAYCNKIATLAWKSSISSAYGPKTEGNPFIGWTADQKYTVS